jgi:hypothetical protein
MFEAEAKVRITLQARDEKPMSHQIALHTPTYLISENLKTVLQ